jgi:GNAT superfamily N-acetyltransferase
MLARQDRADAGDLVLREATTADVASIGDLYMSLSETSMQMRFSMVVPLDDARRIARMRPGRGTIAVVALAGGRIVGEARLEDGRDGYELGLTVADSHQRAGLGRRLVGRIRIVARSRGIASFRAIIRIDNIPMLRLLQSVGYAITAPTEGGVVTAEVATDGLMPGWQAGSAPRVLVESRGVWETPETTALRSAGFDVRRCPGPGGTVRATCPLLTHGQCRLVEEADLVACLLPGDDPDCAALTALHSASRPGRILAGSPAEWRAAVQRLTVPDAVNPGSPPPRSGH